MAVLRSSFPREHYTELRNCWLRDGRLSLKAKGLLGYLMSHTEGYRCSQAQMIRESTDGRAAVVGGLAELEAAGYLRRIAARSAGGRFAEDDYELVDPFDLAGRLVSEIDTVRKSAEVAGDFGQFPHRSGLTAAAEPQRRIDPIEDHQEKTKELTTQSTQLRLVDGQPVEGPVEPDPPTLGQRANALAREHHDAVGGMTKFMAVVNVVRRALSVEDDEGRPRYSDERVREALGVLRAAGRPVTLDTLRIALERGTQNVSSSRYGSAPYRDKPADAYSEGF